MLLKVLSHDYAYYKKELRLYPMWYLLIVTIIWLQMAERNYSLFPENYSHWQIWALEMHMIFASYWQN